MVLTFRTFAVCSLLVFVSSSQCFAQETVRDLADLATARQALNVLGDMVAGEWPSSKFAAVKEECTCTIVGDVKVKATCNPPPPYEIPSSIPCTLEDVPCSASMEQVIANCQALIRQSAEGTGCTVEFPGGDLYQCILPEEDGKSLPSEESSK